MAVETPNRLYFGDCLDVMREDFPDDSVDLIYLDPPFNSKRLYNAFIGGAQWVAFDDTWRWHEAIEDFDQVAGQPRYKGIMEGLRLMLGDGPQLAYLSYMANRLVECKRVLKPTGSVYLHCDPTMSHSLKAVMDGIFGQHNFRNELTWKRTSAHSDAKRYARVSDRLLFYAFDRATWHTQHLLLGEKYVKRDYRHVDEHGRYRVDNLTGPGLSDGESGEPWQGYDPGQSGRHWSVPKTGAYARWIEDNLIPGYAAISGVHDRLDALDLAGPINWTKDGYPRLKRYLAASKGEAVSDFIGDIPNVNNRSKEHIGYPTQKPVALLERLVATSSNKGDTVLDPFCGCGTAVHAAQNLGRRWMGIDICVNACKVIEKRLRGHFDTLWDDVEFIGMPKTRDDARFMAGSDPFRFERWAASLVDGMEANKKQRGDRGIDGWGRLPIKKGQFIDMVSQVKGGHANPGHVQAFNGARQQAKADLGIFTCFGDRVTNRMRDAAVNTGKFMSAPVVQIYTVEDYFEGRKPALPVAA